MKIIIASDIHGSAHWCKKLLAAALYQNADQIVLLGDLLYHGPRNPLPDGYNPMQVAQMLTDVQDKLICVRGNCDSEVDQMVLPFPMMADYALLHIDGQNFYLTHGHLHGEHNPPPLQKGAYFFNGHTHTPRKVELANGATYCNCGSVSLPKDGTPHSYVVYEKGVLTWYDLETGNAFTPAF